MTLDQTARMLIGMTLGFHIILAVLGMGLPLFLAWAEYLGITRHDHDYLELARRASKAFLVIFGVGAVTGTLVAAELAVIWAPFMAFAGQVVILPFFIEGFAFVTEGMFIGMYLYGWDRFKNPWTHWWLSVPIAVASAASGLLITVVNAWMNSPAGFQLISGQIRHVNPWTAFFNPSVWVEDGHVLFMAYTTTAFVLLAVAAWSLLKNPEHPYYRKAAHLAAAIGTVVIAATIFTGDLSGKWLAQYQPEKLAAAEALFRTQAHAPLAFFGYPNVAARQLLGAIKIPDLLNLLAFSNVTHPVRGLNSFAPSSWPPVLIVHLAFDTMITLGSIMLLVGALSWWFMRRFHALPRWLNWAAVAGGPAIVLTMEAGWLTDEFGRQPWVVYGIMRVDQGITQSPSVEVVGWALVVLIVLLALSVPFILWRMFKNAPLYTLNPGPDDVFDRSEGRPLP